MPIIFTLKQTCRFQLVLKFLDVGFVNVNCESFGLVLYRDVSRIFAEGVTRHCVYETDICNLVVICYIIYM